mmetsp:Transcript_43729/g.81588  ORF Transcript_43729/g.81588 Transcript_43729/m.81588 type:complete len:313 (+) Transcript_43729:58-996(+)
MEARCVAIAACMLAVSAASSHVIYEHDECEPPALSMLQARMSAKAPLTRAGLNPWDVHTYLVGASHKSGTVLLRDLVGRAFLALDDSLFSCQMWPAGEWGLLTLDGLHNCSDYPNTSIRFDLNIRAEHILQLREEVGPDAMRALTMIRDPAVMLASAYCYHHDGQEYGLQPDADREHWPWPGIMHMGPQEGMNALADGMFGVIEEMIKAVRVAGPDFLIMRLEDVTRSSADFDKAMDRMVDFMFDDLISPHEREEVLQQLQLEDMNRHSDPDSTAEIHSNSKDCEEKALAVLPSLVNVSAQLQEYQRALGYG